MARYLAVIDTSCTGEKVNKGESGGAAKSGITVRLPGEARAAIIAAT